MTIKKFSIICIFLTFLINAANASDIIGPLQLRINLLEVNCNTHQGDHECFIQGNIYSQKKLIFSFGNFLSYENRITEIEIHHNSDSKSLPAFAHLNQDYNLRLSTKVFWNQKKIGLILDILDPNDEDFISSEVIYFDIEKSKQRLIPEYNFKFLSESDEGGTFKYYISGSLIDKVTNKELCNFPKKYVTSGRNKLCNDFTVLYADVDEDIENLIFSGNVGKIILEPVTKRTGLTCASF